MMRKVDGDDFYEPGGIMQEKVAKGKVGHKGEKDREICKEAIDHNMEYLDGIFDICSDLMRRNDLMKKRVDFPLTAIKGESQAKEKAKEGTEKTKMDIARLTKQIMKKEKAFWRNILIKKREGVEFIIEKVADHFKLENFEKQILVFFLYLEIGEQKNRTMSISEVMKTLDIKGSFGEKLKKARFFMEKSSLVRNNIISKPAGFFPTEGKHEFCINTDFYFTLSRMIGGEVLSMEKLGKMESEKTDENVGYIKDPDYSIDDVIVNDDIKEEVKLFLDAIKNKALQNSGIFDKVHKGRGNVFLFYGSSGTGKSMMAEAVASYIGKKVLFVEYPKIMSRWQGETDKNIMKVFETAKEKDVVIVMDEADTLLYSRSYAQWEHDIKFVNEMLQALETFEGEIILTTNMEILLDSAVERRVSLKVKFDPPDQKTRERIWQWHLPGSIEVAKNVDFGHLAEKYDFSGGNIKNAVLNASRKFAARGEKIMTMEDLVFGAELEKKGMFSEKYKTKVVKGFSPGQIHINR
ncbi:MAG: ATP-binding protein [Candidatus Omnitrophota bacterium]